MASLRRWRREGGVAEVEGVAEGTTLGETHWRFHFVFPDLRVGFGETAELPVVADESVDIQALFRSGRLEASEVFGGEGLESGDVFAPDDFRLSVNAGFQRIHGRSGLALDGARAGGFL